MDVSAIRNIAKSALAHHIDTPEKHVRFVDWMFEQALEEGDPVRCTKLVEFGFAILVSGSFNSQGKPVPEHGALNECDRRILLGGDPRYNWVESL